MRSSGTPEELERRRARAVVLVMEHDYSTAEAAEAVGATIRTVQRWLANYRDAGDAGIAAVPASGRPPALGSKQLVKLERILLKGPLAAGFPNDLWTCRRVVQVVEKNFGVTFHTSHIGRILQEMGWTPQKPERRAIERDEDGIERFIKFEGPNLKRTWAPKGHTPIVRQVTRSYRKVSAMGAIAVTPWFKRARIFFRPLEGKNFNTDACISFVEQLKQNIKGQIPLVWDRLLVHRSKKMMKYLSKQNRVSVIYLPAYAPELNPTEYLWSYLKEQSMCNRTHLNLRGLFLDSKVNLCEIRRDRPLAKHFIRHSPLSHVWRL